MILLSGKRTARIKHFIDHKKSCKNCGDFDFDVKVTRMYWHLFLLPLKPSGKKIAQITCRNCGEPIHSDVLQRHYENTRHSVLFFYSIPIFVICLVAAIVFANINMQKDDAEFLDNPKIGEVFKITSQDANAPIYHFLGIAGIKIDTGLVNSNNEQHYELSTGINEHDLFVRDKKVNAIKSDFKEVLYKIESNPLRGSYGNPENVHHRK